MKPMRNKALQHPDKSLVSIKKKVIPSLSREISAKDTSPAFRM